jgi:hypothetical protein
VQNPEIFEEDSMIGVVASNMTSASMLIADLGLGDAIPLAYSAQPISGRKLDALIFDESVCPPSSEVLTALVPAVASGRKAIFAVSRIEPRTALDDRFEEAKRVELGIG